MSEPTTTKTDPVHGITQEHPAFGNISVSRIGSGAGTRLFDSDIAHTEFVEVQINRAQRTRANSHDYHFPIEELVTVRMSMAQWASFVSSFNTMGVPCTLESRRDGDIVRVEELDDEPRLAVTMQETRTAASRAFDGIITEVDELDRLIDAKAGVREIREVLHTLRARIDNAPKNVDYATRTLAKHAENVVQKARFDIESMVAQHAAQLGIEAPNNVFEIESGD